MVRNSGKKRSSRSSRSCGSSRAGARSQNTGVRRTWAASALGTEKSFFKRKPSPPSAYFSRHASWILAPILELLQLLELLELLELPFLTLAEDAGS
jgi:hypothetical protein